MRRCRRWRRGRRRSIKADGHRPSCVASISYVKKPYCSPLYAVRLLQCTNLTSPPRPSSKFSFNRWFRWSKKKERTDSMSSIVVISFLSKFLSHLHTRTYIHVHVWINAQYMSQTVRATVVREGYNGVLWECCSSIELNSFFAVKLLIFSR